MRCWHCGSDHMELVKAWPDFYQARKCRACDAGVITRPENLDIQQAPPPVAQRKEREQPAPADPGPSPPGLRPAKISRGRNA